MQSFPRREIRDLLFLSLAAGSADAAGFMGLGRVFTSNMTGNVVLMGIELGQRHFAEAAHSGYVLAVFLAGTAVGAWMSRRIDEKSWPRIVRRVISCEAILLGLFAVLWSLRPGERPDLSYGLVTLLALAMGLQASALHRVKIPGVTTTAITGTLTSLVNGVVQIFTPSSSIENRPSRSRLVFQALVIGLYLAGAFINGVVMIESQQWVGVLPAALALVVVLSHLPDKHS